VKEVITMKRARRNIQRFGVLFLIMAWLLSLSPALVFAQEPSDVEGEEVAADETAETPETAPPEGLEAEEAAAEETDPDKVPINLNNVPVDQVVKFMAEVTGKFVVKHKDVKAQITVFSLEKVSKEKAFALICEALLLENVAVVRSNDTIKLIPAELLKETVVELLPAGVEELPAGIVRKSIPIRFADVAEIEKLVKELLSKIGSMLAHPSSKQIIVTDSANRVANIEAVVAQLDVLDSDQRQVQIFELKHADVEAIAPILKSVLGALAQKAGAAPPGQPQEGKPPEGRPQQGKPGAAPPAGGVEVVPYKAANWLVVVVPKELTGKAKSLVDELDRARPQELQMRSLALKYADARELATQLSSLFKSRPEKRMRDMVEITADERSGSLLVLSSAENFALIKEVVDELDTEDSVQTMTKTYPLEYADAEDIAEQMNNLYSGMQQDYYSYYYYYYSSRSQQAKTRFVPERRTNSVIAIAKPSEFEKISKLIEKLDQPIDAEQVAPRIYRIRYVDAKEMTDVLNKIFGVDDTAGTSGYYDYIFGRYGSTKEEVGRLYGKVRFVPETTTNSIIVTTNNKENFKIIAEFIKDLDKFSPEAANTMVVTLKNAKASAIADQVNSLFAREGARAPERRQTEEEQAQSSYYAWLYGSPQKKEERAISNLIGQVRVVPDTRTNSLLVTTAVQNFELLRELIERLDVESPKVQVRVRLIEITTTRESRIGTRFSSSQSTFSNSDLDNGLLSTFGLTWQELHGNATLRSDVNVNLLVQFLERYADTEILAEPMLVMNNNEKSWVFAGEEFLYPTASQATPQGGVTTSFSPKEAGTRLTITPNINDVDKVVMKVELEVSQTRAGEEVAGAPKIGKSQFNTELAVKNGDTIVVGGIIRQATGEQIRRIPILGHIPGLGIPFRKKDSIRETTELVVFITPTVLRTSEDDLAATRGIAERIKTTKDWQPLRDILVDKSGPK
jgi:type II secretory pathway component GspD/PulD (secretin)